MRYWRSMSRESVALVRAIYELWERNEPAGQLIDADLEYVNPPDAVETGVRRGRRALASIREVYPDFHVRAERFVDAGDDVVVLTSISGRSRSGVEINTRQAYVWTVRDGLAVRFRWFTNAEEALAAVGLTLADLNAD